MTTTTNKTKLNIYQKLQHMQINLKAHKGQFNKFGNYNYRSCEDILEAIKKHLNDVNAIVLLSDTVVNRNERYYLVATAKFIDCDTGESIEVTGEARESLNKKGMDESQITGAASSYARKYALNGLFAIDDTKDADTQAPPKEEVVVPQTPPKPQQTSNKNAREELIAYCDAQKISSADIAKKYGLTPKSTQERFEEVLNELKIQKF